MIKKAKSLIKVKSKRFRLKSYHQGIERSSRQAYLNCRSSYSRYNLLLICINALNFPSLPQDVSSTIDNFIHKQNEANEKLIPDFLFDERKKISIQLPFCERNEVLSKKFIAELNSLTDNKYSVHILWQTREIKSMFKLKLFDVNKI